MKTQYRKKPVVIDAWKVPTYPTAEAYEVDKYPTHTYLDECIALADWCGGVSHMMREADEHGGPCILIPTLEGEMRASPGDYIIRGVKGEFYPCKPDIFTATYDAVE